MNGLPVIRRECRHGRHPAPGACRCAVLAFLLFPLSLHAVDVPAVPASGRMVAAVTLLPVHAETDGLSAEDARMLAAFAEGMAGYLGNAAVDLGLPRERPGGGYGGVPVSVRGGPRTAPDYLVAASVGKAGSLIAYSIRATVFEGVDAGTVTAVAADSGSLAAGLTGLAYFNRAARAFLGRVAALGPATGPAGKTWPTRHPLVFSSPDEGAAVSLADTDRACGPVPDVRGGSSAAGTLFGIPGGYLGSVRNGRLEAPWLPLDVGSTALVTASLPGRYPKTVPVLVTGEERLIPLPRLETKGQHAFTLSTGAGRFLGLGAEYRRYLVPDRLFLAAKDDLYLQYEFTAASRPVFHNDSFFTLGFYPLSDPEARFRFAIATGWGFMLTLLSGSGTAGATYFDVVLEPAAFIFEFRSGDWSLVLEPCMRYATGTGSGLLQRGWLSNGDFGPLVGIGVMKRW